MSQLVKLSKIHLTDKEKSYDFTLTFSEVRKDHMEFLLNGVIGSDVFTDITVEVSTQIGVPINLTEVIENSLLVLPKTPALWAVILDFPSSDTAIFAFGPRNTATS
jgi:hypothetical protein